MHITMQPMSPKRQKPAVSVKDLEKYRKLALDAGASAARIIDASTIRTAWWVRQKCQYGCGGWGSSHCCPPFTPKPKETARVLADYRHALLVAYRFQGQTRDGKPGTEVVPADLRPRFSSPFFPRFSPVFPFAGTGEG